MIYRRRAVVGIRELHNVGRFRGNYRRDVSKRARRRIGDRVSVNGSVVRRIGWRDGQGHGNDNGRL